MKADKPVSLWWIHLALTCLLLTAAVPPAAAIAQGAEAPTPEPQQDETSAEEEQEEEQATGWKARLKSMVTREPDEEGEGGRRPRHGTSSILMTNLHDPGQPFEFVHPLPIFSFRDWSDRNRPLGGLQDPLVVSVDRALTSIEEQAVMLGGNAVIGLTITFENRTEVDEGRVMVYGMVVRIPEPISTQSLAASAAREEEAGAP